MGSDHISEIRAFEGAMSWRWRPQDILNDITPVHPAFLAGAGAFSVFIIAMMLHIVALAT